MSNSASRSEISSTAWKLSMPRRANRSSSGRSCVASAPKRFAAILMRVARVSAAMICLLGQVGTKVGALDEALERGHQRGALRELEEQRSLAGQLVGGQALDEGLGGPTGDGVELAGLGREGARGGEALAADHHLADEADGERLAGADAAAAEQQVADQGVADVAAQAGDA